MEVDYLFALLTEEGHLVILRKGPKVLSFLHIRKGLKGSNYDQLPYQKSTEEEMRAWGECLQKSACWSPGLILCLS